jgi:hypothetical protein
MAKVVNVGTQYYQTWNKSWSEPKPVLLNVEHVVHITRAGDHFIVTTTETYDGMPHRDFYVSEADARAILRAMGYDGEV